MDTVTEINAWLEQGKALVQRLQAEQGGGAAPVADVPPEQAGVASTPDEVADVDKFAAPDPAQQPDGSEAKG